MDKKSFLSLHSRRLLFVLLACALVVGGCQLFSPQPPQSVAQLGDYYASGSSSLSDEQILQHNLRRVLDSGLPAGDRLKSLLVMIQLDGFDDDSMRKLSLVLENPQTPPSVRRAVVGVLAGKDLPGISVHVERELGACDDVRLRNTLLDWATRHPSEQLLDEIVTQWAKSDPDDAAAEKRYRRAVETIACRTWPDAMLELINADKFSHRASALRVLTGRMSVDMIRERLTDVLPNSVAMSALRYYATQLNTVLTADNFLPAVEMYVANRSALASVASIVSKWGQQEDYSFSPSDLHLLKYLSGATENVSDRSSLEAALVSRMAASGDVRGIASVSEMLASLGRADLHRVSLLLRWLDSMETRRRLNIVAARDREDAADRWGGLLFINTPGVQALLYPSAADDSDSSGGYVATERFVHDAANSLCWFMCYFDCGSVDEIDAAELRRAKNLALPGVLLVGKGRDYFSAFMLCENGRIVPLGVFQFAI